jgi:hypothetical protein
MNRALLDQLLAMRQRDSDTRSRLLSAGRLYGGYAEEMQQVNREHAEQLARIIAVHGWPGHTLVGEEGARAAWLIAQHAIGSPDLQRGFLVQLETAVASGEAPPRQLAYLTDRIRFNEERPQRYGLVLDWDADGQLTCAVEDPAQLDARRAAVGLPPFAEDLAQHRQAVAAEGGRCPDDVAAYQASRRAWARRAGWIR